MLLLNIAHKLILWVLLKDVVGLSWRRSSGHRYILGLGYWYCSALVREVSRKIVIKYVIQIDKIIQNKILLALSVEVETQPVTLWKLHGDTITSRLSSPLRKLTIQSG